MNKTEQLTAAEYRDLVNGKEKKRHSPTPKVSCKCVACGKDFEVHASLIRRDGKRLFCTRKCRDITGDKNPRYKPDEGWTNCEACGIKYKVKPVSLRLNKHNHYCSDKCRDSYTKKKFGGGKRADLGNTYYRSRWEANYARYLNFLVRNKEIVKWEYEVDTFEFVKIKRGTRFYTPDFKVFFSDGHYEYHEVKGYMCSRSITRHKRMQKYFPNEKVIMRAGDWFKANYKTLSKIIPGWETAGIKKYHA